MHKKYNDLPEDVKHQMRGGQGDVVIKHFWSSDELKSANRLFAKLILAPGSSIGFHRHENEEEIFVIIRGEAEVTDDDKGIFLLNAGDTIHTGDGAGHAVKSVGSEPLEMLAVINKY